MKKTARIFFSIALLFLLHGMAHATALGDLASGMQPGQWKELVTNNLSNDTLLYMNANGELWYADMSTTWTNYIAWSPTTQELFWTGAPHLVPYAFLRYSAAQNRWYNDTNVPDCMRLGGYSGCFSHGYHAGTIDAEKGDFYFISGKQVFGYNIARKQWTSWSQDDLVTGPGQSLEYFYPLGKLAYHIGTVTGYGGSIQLIDPVTRKRAFAVQQLTMGDYHNTMAYSAPHRKLYFGGGNGSGAFYSMDSASKAVRLADAPENFSCIATSLAVDPVTGNPLLLSNANNYYVYNSTANQWTKIASPPAALIKPDQSSTAALATGIPEYGVVFYMSPNLKKVYLYKHAILASTAGDPDRRLPRIHTQARIEMYNLCGRRIGLSNEGLARTTHRPMGVYLTKTDDGANQRIVKMATFR